MMGCCRDVPPLTIIGAAPARRAPAAIQADESILVIFRELGFKFPVILSCGERRIEIHGKNVDSEIET